MEVLRYCNALCDHKGREIEGVIAEEVTFKLALEGWIGVSPCRWGKGKMFQVAVAACMPKDSDTDWGWGGAGELNGPVTQYISAALIVTSSLRSSKGRGATIFRALRKRLLIHSLHFWKKESFFEYEGQNGRLGRKFLKALHVRMLIHYILKNSIRRAQK